MKKIDSFSGEYDFLSNFSYSPITRYGISVPTAEHAFQMLKATDYDGMQYIALANTPGLAKSRGRAVKIRGDWEQVKYEIMYAVQMDKYQQNPQLLKKLLATGDAELEEGNWWHDNIWGNCKCDRCKDIEGRNMLGEILMKVRSELNGKNNSQTASGNH